MVKKRLGRRVEFRLPEDHPFFIEVPVGERQEWLEKVVSIALGNMKRTPDPGEAIQRLENKIDQVLSLLASGISINDKPVKEPKKEEPLIEKPKPAVKNPKALADF
ncbi:hypothetical protein SAMN02745133_02218 [Desulforamulus putei DSM 12395]|uniref:Uncharacterized protein n=1 Tax=Desulforamulus putei DSM 12395 TaxID=1121429 RepID=A0A1M5A8V0_9FIRM|nr:hypothetical protein [Desulforamulus putei]SHF26679.1 hypothetical protein SAMN02745133_02218 [Desulforamulus putei DSM 12395]